MKKLILFLLLNICVALPFAHAQKRDKKVLFIIVDGISADVLEKVETPQLDAIASEGGYTRAYVGGGKGTYSETPTISAVGYNSLLTGTWYHKHHVAGNSIKDPNYHYWTIFRFLEEQYPQKKTAIFSTWLDNRTKLIGEGLKATGNLQLDYHFDGFELDTVRFPHDDQRQYIHQIDELVVDEAARYVKQNGPDLSWVYLEYTDDMGHKYGDGPQMYEGIRMADDQIGRIWKSIQFREKEFQEDWMIVITTDHGRDQEGKHHGGQSDRERTTWITTNESELNDYFKDFQPGIVSIFPTMARYLDIQIPEKQLYEVDGIPWIGPISIVEPKATLNGNKVTLQWKAIKPEGKVKILVSTTNHFREGKKDKYREVGEVPTSSESFEWKVKDENQSFYKIVLKGPENTINCWIKDH